MIITLIIFMMMYIFIGTRRTQHVPFDQFGSARQIARAIMISILMLFAGANSAHGADSTGAEQFKQQMVVAVTPANSVAKARVFRVVLLCDTQDSRTIGLQGFRQLMKDEAALFVFNEPKIVSFWMGSVAYPIDIIFLGSDKKVTRVCLNCKPGSKDLYPSVKPVKWVIETTAGSKIRVGDSVKIQ